MSLRFRRILANTTLVLVSLSVCALLAEGVLRLYVDLFFPKMMVIDDRLGWRHTTNANKWFENESGEKVFVSADDHGHRGPGHSKERAPGKFRILVLGDSFTEGVQVGESDVFTARLEQADSKFEVINAGVGGYGTVQEYLYMISEGIEFKPDLVLLMFFENDLTDNLLNYYPGFGPRPYATLTSDGVKVIETLDASDYRKYILSAPFEMVLNKHSYLYYFVNSRMYQPMFAAQMRQMQQADMTKFDAHTRTNVFFGVLKKFGDYLEKQNTPFLVVLIPTREGVTRGSSDVTMMIGDHCRTQNINCLPLIKRFQEESASGPQLYFDEDIHWTKDGHRVAADEILKHVRSQDGIKSPRFDLQ